MATLIRCYQCKDEKGAGTMFDKSHVECPECGAPRRGFNKYLRTASLNNALYAQADGSSAQSEKISAYQAAKEFVASQS
jgi:hypothetical protein